MNFYLYDNTLIKDKMRVFQKRLDRVANRETSTHYFIKEADYTDQYYTGRQELSNQDFLGLITGYDKDKKILIFKNRDEVNQYLK